MTGQLTAHILIVRFIAGAILEFLLGSGGRRTPIHPEASCIRGKNDYGDYETCPSLCGTGFDTIVSGPCGLRGSTRQAWQARLARAGRETQASPVSRVWRDCQVSRDWKGTRDCPASRDSRDRLASPESRGYPDCPARPASPASRVYPVKPASPDSKGRRG